MPLVRTSSIGHKGRYCIFYGIYGRLPSTGRSIPVVRLLWEQVDRVRFSAPRQNVTPSHRRGGRLDVVSGQ